MAVGRAPRTADIGLEATKVQVERGFIRTDEWMQTREPGIFAIGDVVAGLPQLAHVAAMAGMVVAAKVAGKRAQSGAPRSDPGLHLLRAANWQRRPDRSASQGPGVTR